MKNIFAQIQEYLEEKEEPSYRFKQILHEIFENKVLDFSKMTTLSLTLREELTSKFSPIIKLTPVSTSKADQVEKVLFELSDGQKVETVSMMLKNEAREWQSLCVSSQVGCGLGCKFCTTGLMGYKRNLTINEILDQVLYFYIREKPVNNIVFMGMGEPLLNDELFEALNVLTADSHFNFGQRRLSVSTVGIIPNLKRLIREFPQVNITFSLHHPIQSEREQLMPIAKKYKTADVFKVLDAHIRANKRKVLIAYTMLKGVNDSKEALDALIKLIRARKDTAYLYHVNLITYHPTSKNAKFQPSTPNTIGWFQKELEKAHISVTKRMSLGDDIDAACGQLYARSKE